MTSGSTQRYLDATAATREPDAFVGGEYSDSLRLDAAVWDATGPGRAGDVLAVCDSGSVLAAPPAEAWLAGTDPLRDTLAITSTAPVAEATPIGALPGGVSPDGASPDGAGTGMPRATPAPAGPAPQPAGRPAATRPAATGRGAARPAVRPATMRPVRPGQSGQPRPVAPARPSGGTPRRQPPSYPGYQPLPPPASGPVGAGRRPGRPAGQLPAPWAPPTMGPAAPPASLGELGRLLRGMASGQIDPSQPGAGRRGWQPNRPGGWYGSGRYGRPTSSPGWQSGGVNWDAIPPSPPGQAPVRPRGSWSAGAQQAPWQQPSRPVQPPEWSRQRARRRPKRRLWLLGVLAFFLYTVVNSCLDNRDAGPPQAPVVPGGQAPPADNVR